MSATVITTGGAAAPATTDRLTARRYAHPALPEQPVVRLVPGALGEAEDLALEFLGLVRQGEPADVGRVPAEALGFPAWALVHDPANGHHALALVKEMERLARQARTRPGTAKDGFEALAARLGRTVPHFLPTYLEQVGRTMIEAGNKAYAAAFFDKAREAERVHGLEPDEDRLRAVFVEFALSGALTVKALRRYVKDLSARLDGSRAWEAFRQLCVERSAAGMPPYAGLAEDARSLLRRSGLSREAAAAAERELLGELLGSPAIGRAPVAFWSSWRERLTELTAGAGDGDRAGDRAGDGAVAAQLRRRLLEVLPTPSGESRRSPSDFSAAWLDLLAATSADTLLTGPQGEAGAPAAWLSRWAGHLVPQWGGSERSAETIALVRRMADRLRRDAVPVDLFASVPQSRHALLLDVLDVLVAADVPVALPPELLHGLDLVPWLDDRAPGERDLAAVAADPRLRPALRRAVGELRHRSRSRAARPVLSVPVLAELLGEWVDEQVERLERCRGLAAAEQLLSALSAWRAQIAEIRPDAVRRIAELDVAALLGRTVRAGLVDEVGWPALEEACAILDGVRRRVPGLRALADRSAAAGTGQEGIRVSEAWPALIARRGDQVVVAGPDEVLMVHHPRVAMRQSGHHDLPQFRYADGELLVAWRQQNGRWRGYWSARPDDEFDLAGVTAEYPWQLGHISLPLPDGGRTTGRRPLRAGDTAVPHRHPVWSDGTGYWAGADNDQHGRTWTEYDPLTSVRGRASLPPWLSASSRLSGLPLAVEQCEVLPLQPGQESTPLGTDGSLVGRWIRRDAERVVLGTPDGRMVELRPANDRAPVVPLGLVRLPGGAELLLTRGIGTQLEAYPGDGGCRPEELLGRYTINEPGGLSAAGTGVVVAPPFWHNLRPRDEPGSLALRALTDARAADLLAAARPREHRADEEQTWVVIGGARLPRTRPEPVPTEEVARLLPQVTDPLLRAGVAGAVLHAIAIAARAAAFRAAAEQTGAARSGKQPAVPPRREHTYRPPFGDDLRIRLLTEVSRQHEITPGREDWTVLNQVRAVAGLFLPASEGTRGASAFPAPGVLEPAGSTESWSAESWSVERRDLGTTHVPWVPLLHRLPELTLRAVSEATAPQTRETLRLLLAELLRLPLGAAGGTLREVVLEEQLDNGFASRPARTGQVLRRADRTVVILGPTGFGFRSAEWLALDHDPSGAFGRIGPFATGREHRVATHIDPARLRALLDRAAAEGPAPWRPDAATAVQARTGAGTGLAMLLLAGLPGQGALAALGLGRGEEAVARRRLGRYDACALSSVVAAFLPADPAALWREGPDVAAGARRWTERFGRHAWPPESLAAAVNGADPDMVDALLDAEHTSWLVRRTTQRVVTTLRGQHSVRLLAADDHTALPPGHTPWSDVEHALGWLAYHLPYGDPLRARLPEALRAVRARLADPGLLLDLHVTYTAKGESAVPAFRAALGAAEPGGAGQDGLVRLSGAVVLAPEHGHECVLVRPAALDGPHDPLFDLLVGLGGGDRGGEVGALRRLMSPEADRLVEAGTGPSGTPHAAQDPSASVPDLVREVAGARGLSPDAAALYLMLLALPDPADRRVAAWTGWKPARLRAARAALLAADGLVVEAKRARAGRSLFLPGGWQESKAPGIPMESWKAGLYPLSTGVARWPGRPVPELFALAWSRVREGDVPGYEQPVSPATRRTSRKAAR